MCHQVKCSAMPSTHLIQDIISFFKCIFGMSQKKVSHLYVVKWQWLKDGLMRLLFCQHICSHTKDSVVADSSGMSCAKEKPSRCRQLSSR